MTEINVAAVSYLNTKPFIYGIQHSGLLDDSFKLFLQSPSNCAKMVANSTADIGLVPVAAIPFLKGYNILTNYCLACDGNVNTVSLFSEVPLNQIEVINLDYQSRTSVKLIKLLASEYWKIKPVWKIATTDEELKVCEKSASLIIGDRAFSKKHQHEFEFDLGQEWKNYSGLPFVFALWVAKETLNENLVAQFETALEWGLENKLAAIEELTSAYPTVDITQYLTQNIKFKFNNQCQEAVRRFLNYFSTATVNN